MSSHSNKQTAGGGVEGEAKASGELICNFWGKMKELNSPLEYQGMGAQGPTLGYQKAPEVVQFDEVCLGHQPMRDL